jgi:DNA-binding NarL/FixJ family response regulator
MIRVLIADDQDIVRAGLAIILDGQPDIDVVGQAANGREAVTMARQLRPDVCLFDIRMPQLDGVEATRQLAGPGVEDPVAVIVITTFDTDEYVHGALKAGARGFLLKDAGPDLLVQAIRAAAAGDALIAPSVTARLLATFSSVAGRTPPTHPAEALTDREEEVVLTVARGRTNPEIADELHISLSTVKTHLAAVMTKLGARNRVEIAMWAYETGRIRT